MTGQLVSDVPRQTARKEVDEPPESLCSMLRELRSRHGLSQYDLARNSTMPPATAASPGRTSPAGNAANAYRGPYWRKWLCAVLDLPQQDVDLAAAVARCTRRA